jgi:hypothetical protein
MAICKFSQIGSIRSMLFCKVYFWNRKISPKSLWHNQKPYRNRMTILWKHTCGHIINIVAVTHVPYKIQIHSEQLWPGNTVIHKEKNNRMKKIKKIPVYPKSSWSTSGKNYSTFNIKCKNLDISVKNQHILKYQNNFTKLTREDSE